MKYRSLFFKRFPLSSREGLLAFYVSLSPCNRKSSSLSPSPPLCPELVRSARLFASRLISPLLFSHQSFPPTTTMRSIVRPPPLSLHFPLIDAYDDSFLRVFFFFYFFAFSRLFTPLSLFPSYQAAYFFLLRAGTLDLFSNPYPVPFLMKSVSLQLL